MNHHYSAEITVPLGSGADLKGLLEGHETATGLIVFVHDSGSSRFCVRNNQATQLLRNAGFATLLMDLLTASEAQTDALTHEQGFDIPLLTGRITGTLDWLARYEKTGRLPIGLFAASMGAAAALSAAASQPARVKAIVCTDGRPDLAADALEAVQAPTLFLVGSDDTQVLRLNQMALKRIPAETQLIAIGGVTHVFEELGTLDQVAQHAANWFNRCLLAQD